MAGVHHSGVERVLQEDGVELLRDAVVDQLAIVPALEAQAVSIDSQRPLAGRVSGGQSQDGADEVATSHKRDLAPSVSAGIGRPIPALTLGAKSLLLWRRRGGHLLQLDELFFRGLG